MTESESKWDRRQAETRSITQITETTDKADMQVQQVQRSPFNVIPPNFTEYLVSSHHTFSVKALISFKIETVFSAAY